MTYSEWLREQTPDQQSASLDHMQVCAELGEALRADPLSEKAKELQKKVAAYYTGKKI